MYRWLIIVLLPLLLTGCDLGSPAKQPEPSDAQVKMAVEEKLTTEEMRAFIRETIREQQAELTAQEIVVSTEGQKVMQEEMKKLMEAPEVQKALEEAVKKTMDSPEVQKAIQEAVMKSFQQLLQQAGQGEQQEGQGEQQQ